MKSFFEQAEVDRLGQIIEGTALDSFDCSMRTPLSGDVQNRAQAILCHQGLDQIEAKSVGEHVIEDNHIEPLVGSDAYAVSEGECRCHTSCCTRG